MPARLVSQRPTDANSSRHPVASAAVAAEIVPDENLSGNTPFATTELATPTTSITPPSTTPTSTTPTSTKISFALVVASVCALVSWTPLTSDGWNRWWFAPVITVHEVIFAVLAVWALPQFVSSFRAGAFRNTTVRVASLFVACNIAQLALQPSMRGIQTVLRLIAGLCIITMFAPNVSKHVTTLIKAVIGLAAFEALVCTWQWATDSAVGLTFLGESSSPFLRLNPTSYIPMGTLFHPYQLAGFGLFAAGLAVAFGFHGKLSVRWSMVGVASGATMTCLTLSRSGGLGLIALIVASMCALIPAEGRSRNAKIVGVLIVFTVVFGALRIDGWTARSAKFSANSTSDQVSSGRVALIRQAIEMVKEHPFGVGPGNYGNQLRSDYFDAHPNAEAIPPSADLKVVHSLPLIIFSENGFIAIPMLMLIGALMLRNARRIGWSGMALFVAPLPFVLLDVLFWWLPAGVFFMSIWIGSLMYLAEVVLPDPLNSASTSSSGMQKVTHG
jgi:hypothetical protein